MNEHFANTVERLRQLHWLTPLLLAALTGLVFANSFGGSFVFDDVKRVVLNPAVRTIAASVTEPRPVLHLTFAINYMISQYATWSYHLFNVTIHIVAALLLYGILCHALSVSARGSRSLSSVRWIAFVIASIWAVHPMQTASVTYIWQRGEMLMGMWYLLSAWCLIRGSVAPLRWRRIAWYGGSILACGVGMGTKEVMITAPVLLFFYDRFFVSTSLKEQFKERWGLYLGLALTWGLLAAEMVMKLGGEDSARPIIQSETSPLYYAVTEAGVMFHYLRSVFVPCSLPLDLGWPLASSVADLGVGGLVILLLGVGSVVLLFRRPQWGFIGLWFFGVLAPSSSVFPRPDPACFHRMYLPLAAVSCASVLGGAWLLRLLCSRSGRLARLLAGGAVGGLLLVLSVMTVVRNSDYHSPVSFWLREITYAPSHARPYNELAMTLINEGRYKDAEPVARAALWVQTYAAPPTSDLATLDLFGLVPKHDRRGHALTHTYLGIIHEQTGRVPEAARHYRRAVSVDPSVVAAQQNLDRLLM